MAEEIWNDKHRPPDECAVDQMPPIRGLRTWRLALAFYGSATGYTLFETLISGYARGTMTSKVVAYGAPALVSLACISIAYAPVFRRIVSRWRSRGRR